MRKSILGLIAGGVIFIAVGVVLYSPNWHALGESFETTLPAKPAEASSEQVHQMCGASCHAYPPADSFPKFAWRKEVKQGYDFFRDSKLQLDYPSLESVVQYYEKRAPEEFPSHEEPVTLGSIPVDFRRLGFQLPEPFQHSAIANVNLVH